jgi:hypothetical protein
LPAPASSAIGGAYVIRAGEKPGGWRTPNPNWRKEQFIQAAIVAIQASQARNLNDGPLNSLPDEFNETRLTKAVNAVLQSDPAFSEFRKKNGRAKVSRQAVRTALQMMREANR